VTSRAGDGAAVAAAWLPRVRRLGGMAVCPQCGEKNPDRAKFCLDCGTPLAVVASVERRERRVVSVLFADLAGFTRRSERLDVEDVEGFLAPYFGVLRGEVERTGGVVVKWTGDGVMAMFGAVVAHEDDPERAVRCGLGICERVSELAGGELHVRVGVTSGEVLVTWGERGEIDAMGDVANTAARLESAAPTDGVLVDE
jgi:class 3 adenylate cyclase